MSEELLYLVLVAVPVKLISNNSFGTDGEISFNNVIGWVCVKFFFNTLSAMVIDTELSVKPRQSSVTDKVKYDKKLKINK